MFKRYAVLLFCCFSLLTTPLVDGPSLAATNRSKTAQRQTVLQQDLTDLLVRIEGNYARMHSLECSFQQLSKHGTHVRKGNGQAFFFRPGSTKGNGAAVRSGGVIRWEYHDPEAQTIINDGQEIRIYTPADKQLLISSAQALDTDLTYALFTGKSSLTEIFTVGEADSSFQLSPPRPGLQALHLVPKEPQSQLKRAQIWINKDLQIERLLMEDYFDALTELSFSDIHLNSIRADDRTRIQQLRTLETAPDTEIIRQ